MNDRTRQRAGRVTTRLAAAGLAAGIGVTALSGAAGAQTVTRPADSGAEATEQGTSPVLIIGGLVVVVGAGAAVAVALSRRSPAEAASDVAAGDRTTLRPTVGGATPPPAAPRPAPQRPIPPPTAANRVRITDAPAPPAAAPTTPAKAAPAKAAPATAVPTNATPAAPASPAPSAPAVKPGEVDGAGTASVSTSNGSGATTRGGYKKRVKGAHVPRTDVLSARAADRDADPAPDDEPESKAESMRNLLSGFQAGNDRARVESMVDDGEER